MCRPSAKLGGRRTTRLVDGARDECRSLEKGVRATEDTERHGKRLAHPVRGGEFLTSEFLNQADQRGVSITDRQPTPNLVHRRVEQEESQRLQEFEVFLRDRDNPCTLRGKCEVPIEDNVLQRVCQLSQPLDDEELIGF